MTQLRGRARTRGTTGGGGPWPDLGYPVAAWRMNEASGNRLNYFALPDKFYLFEAHGTVNGEAGLIGNAARPVIDPSDRDYRTYGEWLRMLTYVGWYPLGRHPWAGTPPVGAGGYACSPGYGGATVAVAFKPETGIVATGGHYVGGLANYTSFPYSCLMLVSTNTAGYEVYAANNYYPGNVTYATPKIACALDTWHVGLAWFDPSTNYLYCSIDGGTPTSVACPNNEFDYGDYTYWMTGPRFKGLIDTGILWDRVLSAGERAAFVATMLGGVDVF